MVAMGEKIWVQVQDLGWELQDADEENLKGVWAEFEDSHLSDYEDAALMVGLNEAALLNLVQRRFKSGKPFTLVEKVLVSVNPYKPLGGGNGIGKEYFDSAQDYSLAHLGSVAEEAYRCMMAGPKRSSQSILVNGESGAGKTESAKFLMKFLAQKSRGVRDIVKQEKKAEVDGYFSKMGLSSTGSSVSGKASVNVLQGTRRRRGRGRGRSNSTSRPIPSEPIKSVAPIGATLERNLSNVHPILEAFGNAMTTKNNNSSRFGKFVQLEYDRDGVMLSGQTRHFLLEKTRVTKHGNGQRTFHIFYQLMSRLSCGEADDEEFQLGPMAEEYRYLVPTLSEPGEVIIHKESVHDDISDTVNAFEAIGVLGAERKQLWQTLLAILEIGNIEFADTQETGGISGCKLDCEDGTVKRVSSFLGVEPKQLEQSLCFRTVAAGAGKRTSLVLLPLNKTQALESRDGLAKSLYTALFDFVLFTVNRQTNPKHDKPAASIGILDIFGFEVVEHNSFEQLCINYSNEVLQQRFDHHLLSMEQDLYEDEGLLDKALQASLRESFNTNEGIIALFDSRGTGILHLLDEASALGNTDAAFLATVVTKHERSTYIQRQRVGGASTFVVKHHCSQVEYDVAGFVSKNMDALQADIADLLYESENKFVASLFQESTTSESAQLTSSTFASDTNATNAGPSTGGRVHSAKRAEQVGVKVRANRTLASTKTICTLFRKQLNYLDTTMAATHQHFVRCIKPNHEKIAGKWDSELILNQFRYLSISAMVNFRNRGMCERLSFDTFTTRYRNLLFSAPERNPIQWLLTRLSVDVSLWKIGSTKVFLERYTLKLLDTFVNIKTSQSAKVIQKFFQKRTRSGPTEEIACATKLQGVFRSYSASQTFYRTKQACILIQRFLKTICLRRSYQETILKTVTIQSWWRMILAMGKYHRTLGRLKCFQNMVHLYIDLAHRRNKSARVLQRNVRGRLTTSEHGRKLAAACQIQARFRGYLIRKRWEGVVRGRKDWCGALLQHEVVILVSTVSYNKKSRVLVLTSTPRILVFNPKTEMLQVAITNTKVFAISPSELWVHGQDGTKARTLRYSGFEEAASAVEWVRMCVPQTALGVVATPPVLPVPSSLSTEMLVSFPDFSSSLMDRIKKGHRWETRTVQMEGNCLIWLSPDGPCGGMNITGDLRVELLEPKEKKDGMFHQIKLSKGMAASGSMIFRSKSELEIAHWLNAIRGVIAEVGVSIEVQPTEDQVNELASLKDAGNKLFKAGEYEKAAAEYTNATRFSEQAGLGSHANALAALNNRAMCHLKLGNYNDCVIDTSRVLDKSPDNAKAHMRKALALEVMGDFSLALKHIREAERLDPSLSSVLETKERILGKLQDVETKEGCGSPRHSIRKSVMEDDGSDLVTAQYDYECEESENSKFSFVKGDLITVVDKYDDGWWKGRTSDGRTGEFPGLYVI